MAAPQGDNSVGSPCKIKKLAGALRAIHSTNPEVAEKIRIEADYFERNAQRTYYPKFRRQHLFVGSGVIEAGCYDCDRIPPQTVRNVLDRAAAWRASKSARESGIAKPS